MKNLSCTLVVLFLVVSNIFGQLRPVNPEFVDPIENFPDTVCLDTELEFSIDKKNIRNVEVSLIQKALLNRTDQIIKKISLSEEKNVISFAQILGENAKCNKNYTIVFTYNSLRSFNNPKKGTYTQSKELYIACCNFEDELITCRENLIKYPNFVAGKTLLEDPWFRSIGKPSISSKFGYLDQGYGVISGNNIATDALSTYCTFRKEKIYKVKFAIKSDKKNRILKSNYKVRVYASNNVRFTSTNHPELDQTTHFIGETSLDKSPIWTEISLSTWKSPKQFKFIIFSIIGNKKSRKTTYYIDNICITEVKEHDDCVEIEMDSNGNYTTPEGYLNSGLTSVSKEEEEITYDRGAVNDIYEYIDDIYNSFETLNKDNCFSVGGYVPADLTNWTEEEELEKQGMTKAELESWTKSIKIPKPSDPIITLDPIAEVITPCLEPFSPVHGETFQGRDIIFIHGLDDEHIQDKLKQKPGSEYIWPADIDQFREPNGHYYTDARLYWGKHIRKYVTCPDCDNNRYLIIPFNCSQNLETAVHTVFTLLKDAMEDGIGVINKKDSTKTECFGKDAVIISHSTGGLVTNVALSIAEQSATSNSIYRQKYGDMSSISENIRAHIALAGAFKGSDYAELAVNAANSLNTPVNIFSWISQTHNLNYNNIPYNHLKNTINNSILVDLAPSNTKSIWANELRNVTVPTLLVTGGHPSELSPLKHIFNKGYDDGVLTTDCQCANMNNPYYKYNKLIRTFDLGIPIERASYYHMDHVGQMGIGKASVGCFPYYSSNGMLQDVKSIPSPIQRFPNYYTFLESSSDHMSGHLFYTTVRDFNTYNTTFQKVNNEETMLAHHPFLFQASGSTQLVSDDFSDLNHEFIKKKVLRIIIKYPKKIKIEVRLWKPKVTIKVVEWGRKVLEFLIWKRTYHRLVDYENENMLDYVYKYILAGN